MAPLLRLVSLLLGLCLGTTNLSATSAADIARAQMVLAGIAKMVEKNQLAGMVLEAPTPLAGNGGKYLLPLNAAGGLTGWAQKSLNAQVGAAVGEKVGEKAAEKAAGHIPVPFAGGLLSGAAKKKGKEMGAVAAVGGLDYMKETSDLSFDTLEDYAVYLHAVKADSSAVAAALAVYPNLEKVFNPAIKAAYKAQSAKKN